MTPVLKTVGILALSGAMVAGALFLSPRGDGQALTIAPPAKATAASEFLSAVPVSSHFLRGVGDTDVAVSIVAPEVEKRETRPPLSVAIVLDRSGSMEGEKLAQAKRAAAELIGKLREGDQFSVTVYGTEVQTIFPLRRAQPDTIVAATRAVQSITERGGTNLAGGLVDGRDQLAKADGQIRRVVLISDGRANNGIQSKEGLANLARETAESGISITTVGVGLDFDEKKMTAIAVAGRGNYYFAERASDLSSLFATELGRVTATAATDVAVTFEPAPGVEIARAYGHNLIGGRAALADLHAGETRRVVFRVRGRLSKSGKASLGTVKLALTKAEDGSRVTESVAVGVTVTDDHHAVTRGQNADAVAMVERALTALSLEKATTLYEAGDAAAARQVIRRRSAQAQKRAAEIGAPKLGAEIDSVARDAEANFAPAPASAEGKKGRKGNRAKSYELLY